MFDQHHSWALQELNAEDVLYVWLEHNCATILVMSWCLRSAPWAITPSARDRSGFYIICLCLSFNKISAGLVNVGTDKKYNHHCGLHKW